MKLSILLALTLLSSVIHAKDAIIVTAAAPTPYATIDGSQLVGPIISIAKQVLSHLNKPVTPLALPWKRALKMLERGDIDIILTIFKNKERAKFAVFTESYWESESVIFMHNKQRNKYREWEDLIGKKGVRFQGTSAGLEFDTFAKERLNMFDVNSVESMIRMVTTGRVDFGVGKHLDIRLKATQSDKMDQISFLSTPISQIPLRFAISKNSHLVKNLDTINQKILDLKASGAIKATIDEFMHAQATHK